MSARAGAARRARRAARGGIAPGLDADLVVWDPDARVRRSTPEQLHFRHKLSPYLGARAARARAPDVRCAARSVYDGGGHPRGRRAGAPLAASARARVSETAASAAALHRPRRPRRRGARRRGARRERRLLRRHREPARSPGAASSSRASTPTAASGWTAGRAAASARARATTGACCGSARRARCVGFDIDTHHFLGNHPPFASVDGRRTRRAARRSTALAARCDVDASSCRSRRCGPARRTCSRRIAARAGHATCGSTSSPTAASRASASYGRVAARLAGAARSTPRRARARHARGASTSPR